MTEDRVCDSNAGEQRCVRSSEFDRTHSICQVDKSQSPSTTLKIWHHNSGSESATMPVSGSPFNILNLPSLYLFGHILAKSETMEARLQSATSSFVEQTSSSTMTSTLTIPTSPTHSVLLSSAHSLHDVAYPGKERLPDLDVENTNLGVSASEQIQIPLQFSQHIQREGEFICGGCAAFINICITFPMNKTMFRQQLHGISGLSAINQLRKDGPRFLYRGLLPPLLQKSSSLSVMFGMYYKCQDILGKRMPGFNIYVNHALAALGAGTFEAIFTPFERIQALMQTREYHKKFSNTLDAFYGLRSYGLSEYYRGFSAIVLRNGPSNVAFFLGREHLQHLGPQSSSRGQKMALDFITGACLGAVISTCFFPLNVIKIHMQCVLGGPFTDMWTTFKTVVTERNGLPGLYKGVHLNYMRSFISWGIINASYEFLMKTFFIADC